MKISNDSPCCTLAFDMAGVNSVADGMTINIRYCHLHSAAPELLEALKLTRSYVKSVHGTIAPAVGEDNLISPDLAKIDAAIAKAEGR